MPILSLDDILLSKKKVHVDSEYFPRFSCTNFLPKNAYSDMARHFPARDRLASPMFEGKRAGSDALVQEVTENNETYRSFFNLIASKEFVEDAVQTLCSGVRSRLLLDRPASLNCGKSLSRVITHPRFSDLPSGTFLTPHTDKPTKVITFLFYMPEPDWKAEYGGETVFYKARNPRHQQNWSNRHLRFRDVTEIGRTRYEPNMLAGFVKSANSWHGVEPVRSHGDIRRPSLNFNISFAEGSFTYRLWYAAMWRYERLLFANAPDLKQHPDLGIPDENDAFALRGAG